LLYRTFNVEIDSSVPLPELPQVFRSGGSRADVQFTISEIPVSLTKNLDWFHHWHGDEDKKDLAISAARQKGKYLLRFPDLADFLVDVRNSQISCHPATGTPADTIRHLLLDQVIPRFMSHKGHLILHASAVVSQSGAGMVFLGKSGWGKSTMASSFHQHGARLITDDSLLLEEQGGHLIAVPAYSGLRLWQDSADLVIPSLFDMTDVAHYSAKKRFMLHNQANGATQEEVHTLFLLNDPLEMSPSHQVRIEPVGGAEAIMAIIKRTFLLDVESMGTVAKQFISASRVASASPAVYSLRYPREFDQLPDVRAAVMSVVNRHHEQRKSLVL
jgi:hypothetical protein